MNLWSALTKPFTDAVRAEKPATLPSESNRELEARFDLRSNFIHSDTFDGEKTPGDIGAPKRYNIDFHTLRARSWQYYFESDIAQTLIEKFVLWAVGSGLDFQAEPNEAVLGMEGLSIPEDFRKNVEARFSVYTKSKKSSHSGMQSIKSMQPDIYKHACVGGDVLIVLRVVDTRVTMQFIDGEHVRNPSNGKFISDAFVAGNKIINGVEVGPSGEEIAYYIRSFNPARPDLIEEKRVQARVGGRIMAYLVKGHTYRVDNTRGVPKLAAVISTIAKLDRFKEAAVGGAEERAKVPFVVTHEVDGEGADIYASSAQESSGHVIDTDDSSIEEVTERVFETTQKQVFNFPRGAKVQQFDPRNELAFNDFLLPNLRIVAAALRIPLDVALASFNESYSASRAALMDWGHVLGVERDRYSTDLFEPFYHLWLEVEVLSGRVRLPGLIEAISKQDFMVAESFKGFKFVGVPIPHIDPLKEIKATKEMLGGYNGPLISPTEAARRHGLPDYDATLAQMRIDLDNSADLLPDEGDQGEGQGSKGGNTEETDD